MPDPDRSVLVPALTASAVVLGGLLAAQLGQRPVVPEAQGALLNSQPGFELLSANVSDSDEALFALDHATGSLLVYQVDGNNERLELLNGIRLDRLFAAAGAGEEELEGMDDDQRRRR